jgi:hypothetical protein
MQKYFDGVEGHIRHGMHFFHDQHSGVRFATVETRLGSGCKVWEIRLANEQDRRWLRYTAWPGVAEIAAGWAKRHPASGVEDAVLVEDSETWHRPPPRSIASFTWLQVAVDLELFLPEADRGPGLAERVAGRG